MVINLIHFNFFTVISLNTLFNSFQTELSHFRLMDYYTWTLTTEQLFVSYLDIGSLKP